MLIIVYIYNMSNDKNISKITSKQFTNEINWLIENSEVHYSDNDCEMRRFKGSVSKSMYESIVRFFKVNGGLTIRVGKGSINLTLPTWKGQTVIEFNACLAK